MGSIDYMSLEMGQLDMRCEVPCYLLKNEYVRAVNNHRLL